MSEVELQRSLEAILMVVDEPVSELVLAQIIEVPTEVISSAQGESAPKARRKRVVDGKLVNIPVPLHDAMGGRRRLCIPGPVS